MALSPLAQPLGGLTPTQANPPSAASVRGDTSSLGVLYQNLPENRKKFNRKWAKVAGYSEYQTAPRTARDAVVEMDKRRVYSGSAPLSEDDTLRALLAATRGEPVTKPKERDPGDFLGNVIGDLGDIGRSLPKLPFILGDTILNAPEGIAQSIGDIGRGDFDKAVSRPGLNLVPGAFTVGHALEGDFKTLAQHPLMTFLDVLPGATKAAEATPVGAAAKAARAAGESAPRPLLANLTRTLEDGELIPNRVGQFGQEFSEGTSAGRFLKKAFGSESRKVSSLEKRQQNAVIATGYHGRPIDRFSAELPNTVEALLKIQEGTPKKYQGSTATTGLEAKYGIDQVRAAELSDVASMWRDEFRTDGSLTDGELAYLDDARLLQSMIDTDSVRPLGDLIDHESGRLLTDEYLARYGDEVYTAKTAYKLSRAERSADAAANAVHERVGRLFELMGKEGADPRLQELIDSIHAGDFEAARAVTRAMKARKVGAGKGAQRAYPGEDLVYSASGKPVRSTEGLSELPGGQMSIGEINNLDLKLRKAIVNRRNYESLFSATPPARFDNWVIRRVGDRWAAQYDGPLAPDEVIEAVMQRDYAKAGVDEQTYRDIEADVKRGWIAAKNSGLDPIFVHRVGPQQAEALQFPKILPELKTAAQMKERVTNLAPYTKGLGIGLRAQGIELLTRLGREEFVDVFTRSYAKPVAELEAVFRPEIERVMEQTGQDFRTAAAHVVGSRYMEWNPDAYAGFRSPRWTDLSGEQLMVPRYLAELVNDLRQPSGLSALSPLMDPVMSVFRTSVLPLSPRWHVNNIIGGAMMLVALEGPGAFRTMRAARQLLRAEERGLDASVELPRSKQRVVGLADEMREIVGQEKQEFAQLRVMQGRTLRRWWDEYQAKHPGFGRVREGGNYVVGRSMDFNAFFDDMYRVTAYLNRMDKELVKGLSVEQAQSLGLATARRVMTQWDQLTPFERNVLRNIFPFYGFTQHLLRFVYSLPMDHPTRVAITASLARTELEDEQTGLPEVLRGMVPLGGVDENGEQDVLLLGAANPFSDVGKFFTLAGFLQGSNPFVHAIGKELGLGENMSAELYPELSMNPNTGMPELRGENPLVSLALGTVPQAQALLGVLGYMEDVKAQYRRDPESATRRLLSGFGVPQMWRKVNPALVSAQAETRFRKQLVESKNSALKSGDYSDLKLYPQGRAYLNELLAQRPEVLEEFRAPEVSREDLLAALIPVLPHPVPSNR